VALYMGQWNMSGSAATAGTCTLNIPPGPYNMAMYNVNTAITFYMGVGTSSTTMPAQLSTVNGLVMHSVPTYWNGYQGESGGYLWVIASSTAASSFNYILSVQQR
jgi:hypothetical protein